MKCNASTNLVCTYWEKCPKAQFCPNVPKGIRDKLNKKNTNPQIVCETK